jgi:hypothetical protein
MYILSKNSKRRVQNFLRQMLHKTIIYVANQVGYVKINLTHNVQVKDQCLFFTVRPMCAAQLRTFGFNKMCAIY